MHRRSRSRASRRVRPSWSAHSRRSDRLHAGDARAGRREHEALQMGRQLPVQRHAVQPADRRQRQRPARRTQSRERQRRHQLARRRRGSRDAASSTRRRACRRSPRIGVAAAGRLLRYPLSGGRRWSAVPPPRGRGHGNLRRCRRPARRSRAERPAALHQQRVRPRGAAVSSQRARSTRSRACRWSSRPTACSRPSTSTEAS